MKTIKLVGARMTQMCAPAWAFFIGSLRISCALLTASLLIHTGLLTDPTSHAAAVLYELPEAVLLIGLLVSVCIEDAYKGRS